MGPNWYKHLDAVDVAFITYAGINLRISIGSLSALSVELVTQVPADSALDPGHPFFRPQRRRVRFEVKLQFLALCSP